MQDHRVSRASYTVSAGTAASADAGAGESRALWRAGGWIVRAYADRLAPAHRHAALGAIVGDLVGPPSMAGVGKSSPQREDRRECAETHHWRRRLRASRSRRASRVDI